MPETATAAPVMTLHVEQEVRIEAPRERVWNALTADVAAWWGAPYLIGEQAERIVLEPHVGGRLYELWAEGEEQGGLWGIVTQLLANRLLEITGTIGMRGAVHGVVQYELEPVGEDGEATLLRLSHRAFGEIAPQAEEGYNQGWQELLATRLKAFVERGERTGLDRGPA